MDAACQSELGLHWSVVPDLETRECRFTMGTRATQPGAKKRAAAARRERAAAAAGLQRSLLEW